MRWSCKRAAAAGRSVEDEAPRSLAIATCVDREVARARLDAVRKALNGCADTPSEDLLRDMRDAGTQDLAG